MLPRPFAGVMFDLAFAARYPPVPWRLISGDFRQAGRYDNCVAVTARWSCGSAKEQSDRGHSENDVAHRLAGGEVFLNMGHLGLELLLVSDRAGRG